MHNDGRNSVILKWGLRVRISTRRQESTFTIKGSIESERRWKPFNHHLYVSEDLESLNNRMRDQPHCTPEVQEGFICCGVN